MVDFVQCRCIRLKWLYSGTSGCIRARGFIREKGVVFGQSGGIPGRVLYSGKSGCILERWLYSGKSGCIRTKWL